MKPESVCVPREPDERFINRVAYELCKRAYAGRSLDEILAPGIELWMRLVPEAKDAVRIVILTADLLAEEIAAAPAAPSGWRGMDDPELPKDGTSILIYGGTVLYDGHTYDDWLPSESVTVAWWKTSWGKGRAHVRPTQSELCGRDGGRGEEGLVPFRDGPRGIEGEQYLASRVRGRIRRSHARHRAAQGR